MRPIRPKDILWFAAVAIGYFLLARISLVLTQGTEGIATIWPASGLLLAAIILGRDRTFVIVSAGLFGSLAANLMSGASLALSAGFTFANLVEALIAAYFVRRWCGMRPSFLSLSEVGSFCLAAILAGSASTIIAWAVTGFGPIGLPLSWFTTVELGILIVAPLLIIVSDAFGKTAPVSEIIKSHSIWPLTVVAGVTALVFWQTSYPLLFLPLVALLGATFRLGRLGAAAGVLLVAAIASALTGVGRGPLSLIDSSDQEVALFLQFYVLTLFATALPLAALLASRETLMRDCAESERMHRLLADNSSDMIVRIGLDGVRRYISPASRAILGYEPTELIGVTPAGAIHPEDRARVIEVCTSLLHGSGTAICSYRQARRDGSYVWLEATYRLVRDEGTGQAIEFIATARDVSRRAEAELAAARASAKLQENYRLLTMAEEVARVGHWRMDVATGSVLWSPEMFRIAGLPATEAPNFEESLRSLHEDDRRHVAATVSEALVTGSDFEFEARLLRPDGKMRHVVSRGQGEIGPDGAVLGLFGVMQDVTIHVEAAQLLESARATAEEATRCAISMAETDELTGVANRRKGLSVLDVALFKAHRSGEPLALVAFDIDHFKRVNDVFGHAMGDTVLTRVAQEASRCLRSGDLIARTGGEEFVVLLPATDTPDAITIADRLRRRVESMDTADGATPTVTVSLGLALLRAGETSADLLKRADEALYEAKNNGRNTYRFAA